MNNANAIEIRNMCKSFKIQNSQSHSLKNMFIFHEKNKKDRHEVLFDINLDIKKGETVCLIGNNGCGKSTLLKLMTKIIYPNKGTVNTNGKIASLLELGAGFHPDFTGRENIYFNSAVFGMSHEQIEKRVNDIIEFSELGAFIDEPIRTYSSGMYMRLAFSIAINVDADILLIDEILAVGDQHFQDKCYEKLKELRDNTDKTIVIVSHSLGVVKELCQRAIWIYKGHIKLDGDPAYVIAEYLEQMALDHKEENRRAKLEGKQIQSKGIIFIESPKDYDNISMNDKDVNIQGWKLCDDSDAVFELCIGKKVLNNINYHPRKEVMLIYSDQYKGLVDEDKIGWNAVVNMQEYISEKEKNGTMRIYARLKREDGSVICEQTAVIVLSEE